MTAVGAQIYLPSSSCSVPDSSRSAFRFPQSSSAKFHTPRRRYSAPHYRTRQKQTLRTSHSVHSQRLCFRVLTFFAYQIHLRSCTAESSLTGFPALRLPGPHSPFFPRSRPPYPTSPALCSLRSKPRALPCKLVLAGARGTYRPALDSWVLGAEMNRLRAPMGWDVP